MYWFACVSSWQPFYWFPKCPGNWFHLCVVNYFFSCFLIDFLKFVFQFFLKLSYPWSEVMCWSELLYVQDCLMLLNWAGILSIFSILLLWGVALWLVFLYSFTVICNVFCSLLISGSISSMVFLVASQVL